MKQQTNAIQTELNSREWKYKNLIHAHIEQQNIRYMYSREWTTAAAAATTTTIVETKKLFFCVWIRHDSRYESVLLYIAYVRLNHVKMAISVTAEFSPMFFFVENFSSFISQFFCLVSLPLSLSLREWVSVCVLAFFSYFVHSVLSFFVWKCFLFFRLQLEIYLVQTLWFCFCSKENHRNVWRLFLK